MEYSRQTERWGVQEIVLQGPAEGNPFTEQWIRGTFAGPGQNNVKVNGFYDGDGIYKVRFMPSYEGEYSFRIEASFLPETQEGSFKVYAAFSPEPPASLACRLRFIPSAANRSPRLA